MSRDLVVLDPHTCHTCGELIRLMCWEQPALFRHGGYGGTQRWTWRFCPGCVSVSLASVVMVSP